MRAVNSELKMKVDAVSRANSGLENMMAATNIAMLFLDTSLRIKHFTDRLAALFSVTPADEGRPITECCHQLEYDNFVKDIRSVLINLTPIEREVRSRDGSWFDIRMRPYRTVDNRIDGVAISFFDVTERENVEQMLCESERRLRQQKTLIDMSRDSIFVWDFDKGILE